MPDFRQINEADIVARICEIDAELAAMPRVIGCSSLGGRKWKLYGKKRRLRMKLARLRGDSTARERTNMLRSAGGCAECGSRCNLSIDHITPLANGGSHALTNLRVLCVTCNSRKGAK